MLYLWDFTVAYTLQNVVATECRCSIISCQYTSWSDSFKWSWMGLMFWLISKYLECQCYLCIKVAINQFEDIPLQITISTDVHILIIFLVFQKWLMHLLQVVSYSWKQFIFFKLTSAYYECATFNFTEPFCLFIFSPAVYVHFCSECSNGWTQQIFTL